MEEIIEVSATDYFENGQLIRLRSELTEGQERLMIQEQQGIRLPLDEDRYFDLQVWYYSDNPARNRFPSMPEKRLNLFFEDIFTSGVLIKPIIDMTTHEIVDGRTRLEALYLIRANDEPCPFPGFEIRSFENEAEMRDFQDQIHFNIRTLNRAQKREKIADAILRHPGWADNRIGVFLQVDGNTVASVSEQLESDGKIVRPLERLGLDGRYTKSVRKRRRRCTSTKEASPLVRMLVRWRDEKGIYPLSAFEVAEMMVTEGVALDNGTVLTAKGLKKGLISEVEKWVRQRVEEDVSVDGWYLYERQIRQEQTVYGLVPGKLRKPDLESAATTVETDEKAKSTR